MAPLLKEGLPWWAEARGRLEAIPFFARGMVMRSVETSARKRGAAVVTEELLREIREAMAGRFPMKRRVRELLATSAETAS